MSDYPALYNAYIVERVEEGWSYAFVKMFGKESHEEAFEELKYLQDVEYWDYELSLEDWGVYVDRFCMNNPRPFTPGSATVAETTLAKYKPRRDPDSAWRCLRASFQQSMSDLSVCNIEHSACEVLNQLKDNTLEKPPVKGLVFGSVQSGKTSNMEALMCMAADEGWNVFILLSGTIEALRQQTRLRFMRDLPSTASIGWHYIDLSGDHKKWSVSNMNLNAEGSATYGARYVITCLKQKGRLAKLIDWLYGDPARTKRMRIVVIDDEADQASVNTAPILDGEDAEEYEQDRKAINQLICRLVNGERVDGSRPSTAFRAMNYISFTATPYANVLNEKSEESLYPKDFVHSLVDPKEYFGCNVIFGNNECLDEQGETMCPGLDVVRIVGDDEVAIMKQVHEDKAWGIPAGLKDALTWFLCAAAVLRVRGYKKPISMLMHTSSRTADHYTDYELIKDYLEREPREALLDQCKRIYEYETSRFGYQHLEEDFSSYGLLDQVDQDVVPFEEIADEIASLASCVGSPMELGGDEGFRYSEGINLCIDNCKANRSKGGGVHLRLVYPTKEELKGMEKAPVFIVMGGNTLARGLTLEGLVCTYFTRCVTQADTLMQMARWFGYRAGYELLQRIWLTSDARKKYRELSRADMDLKQEIARFAEMGLRPGRLGIKVSSMPNVAKFTTAAKNKMQLASFAEYDFTGVSYELTQFDSDESILKQNAEQSLQLLTEASSVAMPEKGIDATVWRSVPASSVVSYLRGFSISEESSLHEDVPQLIAWLDGLDPETFPLWNIAVAGKEDAPSGSWSVAGVSGLRRVERTREESDAVCVNIGSLRDGIDAICDVERSRLSSKQLAVLEKVQKERKGVIEARALLGLENIPLLLIYRVDRLSKPRKRKNSHRVELGVDFDLFGFSVVLPGNKKASKETKLWIDFGERG